MIESLKNLDQELFFLINGLHNDTWDQIMFLISEKEVWFPLYALFIFGAIRLAKKLSIYFILAAILAVGASDFVTSGIMKGHFERYRPSRDEAIMEKVHVVNNYRGGKYGFASSHAANSFALATFFVLFFRRRYSWIWVLFLWAFVISLSRVYLGVHYPGDIIVGGLIGIFFGWLLFRAAAFFAGENSQISIRII